MNNLNVIELTNVNKYRLDEINKIRDYFSNEIKERKDIIKKLNKYIVSFDYLDKIFITLPASFGTLSIASCALEVGTAADIAGSSLTLIFTIGTGISKSLLKVTKKREKKHNKIISLAKNKLNTIDILLSSALNDSEISHEVILLLKQIFMKRVYIERFKVDDRVRISKFKNIFAKGYTPNWSREIFIVNKINDTVLYTYNIKDLNDEKIIGSFYDRELQKSIL